MCKFHIKVSMKKNCAKGGNMLAFVIGFPKSCKMLKSNDWK